MLGEASAVPYAAPYGAAPALGEMMAGTLKGFDPLNHQVPLLAAALIDPEGAAVKLPDLRCLATQLNKYDAQLSLTATAANSVIAPGDILLFAFGENEPHMIIMRENPLNNVLYVNSLGTDSATAMFTNNDISRLYTFNRTVSQSYGIMITSTATNVPLNGTMTTGYLSDINNASTYANGTFENVSVNRKDAHAALMLQDGVVFIGGPETLKPDFGTPAFFRIGTQNGSRVWSENMHFNYNGEIGESVVIATFDLRHFRRHLFKRGLHVNVDIDGGAANLTLTTLRCTFADGTTALRIPNDSQDLTYATFYWGQCQLTADYRDLNDLAPIPQALKDGYASLIRVEVLVDAPTAQAANLEGTVTLEYWSESPTTAFGPYGIGRMEGITADISVSAKLQWALEGIPSGDSLQVAEVTPRHFTPASTDEIILADALFNNPTSVVQRTMTMPDYAKLLLAMHNGSLNYPMAQQHLAMAAPYRSAAYSSSPFGEALGGLASGLIGRIPFVGPMLGTLANNVIRNIAAPDDGVLRRYQPKRARYAAAPYDLDDTDEDSRVRRHAAPSSEYKHCGFAGKGSMGHALEMMAAPQTFSELPLVFTYVPDAESPNAESRISISEFKKLPTVVNPSTSLHETGLGLRSPGQGWSKFALVDMEKADDDTRAGSVHELYISLSPMTLTYADRHINPKYHRVDLGAGDKFYLDNRFDVTDNRAPGWIKEMAQIARLLNLRDHYITFGVREPFSGDSFALAMLLAAYNLNIGFVATGGIAYDGSDIKITPVSHIPAKYAAAAAMDCVLLVPSFAETQQWRAASGLTDIVNMQDVYFNALESSPNIILVKDGVEAMTAAFYCAAARRVPHGEEETVAKKANIDAASDKALEVLKEREEFAHYTVSKVDGRIKKKAKTPEQISDLADKLFQVEVNGEVKSVPLLDFSWWEPYKSIITGSPKDGFIGTTMNHLYRPAGVEGAPSGLIYEGNIVKLTNLARNVLQKKSEKPSTGLKQQSTGWKKTPKRLEAMFQRPKGGQVVQEEEAYEEIPPEDDEDFEIETPPPPPRKSVKRKTTTTGESDPGVKAAIKKLKQAREAARTRRPAPTGGQVML